MIVAAHAFHAAETLGSILPRLPRLWWRPCRHQRRPSHRTCLGTPTYAMVAMPAVLASFSLIPPGCGSGPLHDVRLLFDAHLGGVVGLACIWRGPAVMMVYSHASTRRKRWSTPCCPRCSIAGSHPMPAHLGCALAPVSMFWSWWRWGLCGGSTSLMMLGPARMAYIAFSTRSRASACYSFILEWC